LVKLQFTDQTGVSSHDCNLFLQVLDKLQWFYCNEKREPQINWATSIIILSKAVLNFTAFFCSCSDRFVIERNTNDFEGKISPLTRFSSQFS
jgi:hypothetical protein